MQLSLELEPMDLEIPVPFPTGVEADVCMDIASRQAFGIHKYGRTVADNPLTHKQWLQHAYEECLDQAIYLKRAMREL
jgi:hypothetical protein